MRDVNSWIGRIIVCLVWFGVMGSAAAEHDWKALFNGKDLSGWASDVPKADNDPDISPSFLVRDGMLVSMGLPMGHLITDASFANYRLEVIYRFVGEGGNCGVLVHASTPRYLYKMFPKSIEVQMMHKSAGDFWCIGENIEVENMEQRRPKKEGQNYGGEEGDARRIIHLSNEEKALGEWNTMMIECKGDEVKVWVNEKLVNHGINATAERGKIAIQAEGTEVEFKSIRLHDLKSK